MRKKKSLIEADEGEDWSDSNSHTPEEWKQMAAATLKKEQRITIRINAIDLNAIKQKAADLGMPYQTLIGSTLHGVAVGDINLALTQNSLILDDNVRARKTIYF
jgi:predicted DNA binding CopG/RHH family protein